jgi:hypothetical protein
MPVVLALLLCAVPPTPAPSPGALQRAFAAGRAALVEVQGKDQTGYGVLVGSTGEVLTSLRFVETEEALVRHGEAVLRAHVRLRNAELGVVLLSLPNGGPYPALPVNLRGVPANAWVVVLSRGKKGQPRPQLGRVKRAPVDPSGRFFHIDLRVEPGSPLLDLKGKLVGLVVSAAESGARALALPALKAELAAQAP